MKTLARLIARTFLLSCIFTFFGAVQTNAQAYFDYDTKSDLGVFRPSEGNWYSFSSEKLTSATTRWGLATDTPVPADYNGDGLCDLGIFRDGIWYVQETVSGATSVFQYGAAGDIPISSHRVKPSIVPIP